MKETGDGEIVICLLIGQNATELVSPWKDMGSVAFLIVACEQTFGGRQRVIFVNEGIRGNHIVRGARETRCARVPRRGR